MEQEKSLHYSEIQNKSQKGIKWVGIAEIFIRIFQYGTTLVLARILSPDDFGLIGICFIFTQLAFVLFDFGFSTALIQKKNIVPAHYTTTFIIYLTSASIYILLVLLFSPLIAAFFGKPILEPMLNVLTLVFFFYAINAIPRIQLQKEMRFKRFGSLQIISVFFYGIITITSALFGKGVWSFVYGILAEQLVLTILLNVFAWWQPGLVFDKKAFRELMQYGSSVLGTRIIGYFNVNAPNFIIGKVLGVTALGYYNIAYQLIEFPVQRISKNVLRVMFPAFSELQEDHQNYRDLYKTTVYHLLLILLPVFVGLIIIAPELIELFYGKNWLPAVLPLQLLAAAGFFRSVWISTSVIFLSKGFPKTELKINLAFAGFLIPSLIIISDYGLNYIAGTVSILTFVFLLVAQFKALRIIGLSVIKFQKIYFLPALGVIAFTLIVFLLSKTGLENFSLLFRLLTTVMVSIICYTVIIFLFDRKIFEKLITFIRKT